MRTATHNQNKRRPLTNRMVIAILATGLLTACLPGIAAQANEPKPTVSATASASPSATKAGAVTVGAGTLVVIDDANLGWPDGSGNSGSMGSLSAGETAEWSFLDTRMSPGKYTITTDLGQEATISEMHVTALPAAGLKLDQAIVIRDGAGKRDPLSGFNGRLTAAEVMVIRDAPSRKGAIVEKIQAGQKFAHASAPLVGESNIVGTAQYVAVLLDPETLEYAWVHSAAVSIDKNPGEAERIVESQPDPEDTDALEDEAPEATPTASATPAASLVDKANNAAEAKKKELTAPLTENLGLIGGLLGVVVLIAGGSVVVARRKAAAAAAGDTKPDTTPGEAPSTETATDEVSGDGVDETAEAIDWDEED